MNLYAYLASVVLITLSGVLAPGPLLATTIAEGKSNKFAGFFIGFGHVIVEVPLIIAFYFFGTIATSTTFESLIALAGGLALLYFAYTELGPSNEARPVKGIIAGITMSTLNPYFIIWWLTIGFHLIMQSTQYGLIGLILFIIIHEFCDIAWLGFVSLTTHHSAKAMGPRAERLLTIVSVTMLVIFGIYFIFDGIRGLFL